MEQKFWVERWQEGRIGFHQQAVNPWLERYWQMLQIEPGKRVLVPMCGKSLDMRWLRQQGYLVRGLELSDIACRDFFLDAGQEIVPVTLDNYHRREREGIELLCGDLFELPDDCFADVAAVYDRAALIALPESMRPDYATLLRRVLERGTEVLLISLEHDRPKGPPFTVTEAEVRHLFEPQFTVLRVDEGVPANPRGNEREVVYRLIRQ